MDSYSYLIIFSIATWVVFVAATVAIKKKFK